MRLTGVRQDDKLVSFSIQGVTAKAIVNHLAKTEGFDKFTRVYDHEDRHDYKVERSELGNRISVTLRSQDGRFIAIKTKTIE